MKNRSHHRMCKMILSTSEFFATLLSALQLFYPEETDPNMRTPNIPLSQMAQEYDFIIVGAGSAGCVLANRLTENPDWTVLLLEAGGEDNYISDTPYLSGFLIHSEVDWNFTTVRQDKACLSVDGYCPLSQGMVMGGTSTINEMIYVRGNRADYDGWESNGNKGWGYDELLPYFIKAEDMTEPSLENSPYHGTRGPVTVQYPRFVTPLRDEYVRAGEELGWHFGDYNAENQTVIGYGQWTLNGAVRENNVRAYLTPIRNRKNLHIVLESIVSKVIIENHVARGVEYVRDDRKYRIHARKDVIISAGTVGSSKLLMLSGIGPAKELQRHNIDVVADLPVGSNYIDHIGVIVYFQLSDNAPTITAEVWRNNESILAYARNRDGPLTAGGLGCETVSFFNPLEQNSPPSLETIYCSGGLAIPNTDEELHIIGIILLNVAPLSSGNLTLSNGDFRDPPLIQPSMFDNMEDKTVLEKGIEKVLQFMSTKTMSKYSPQIHTGNIQPACFGTDGKDYIDCVIANYSFPGQHQVSTVRMGPNDSPKTVVSSEDLFVKGLANLRVVDASIMPTPPRGNTNAPVTMVAERAADIIKYYYMNNAV